MRLGCVNVLANIQPMQSNLFRMRLQLRYTKTRCLHLRKFLSTILNRPTLSKVLSLAASYRSCFQPQEEFYAKPTIVFAVSDAQELSPDLNCGTRPAMGDH